SSTATRTTHTLQFLKPYLLSQHKPILCGWLCSAISVYSLSNLVSKFSTITTATTIDATAQGFALGGLVLARLIATYAQHALLWEASLNAVYNLRVHVFDRVLRRELAYFEANDAVSAGDIAYRITAEASDVALTLYALLN
ncbi:ABC transporter type 1, transmembrane domain, partial [Sesbania bispinosa]